MRLLVTEQHIEIRSDQGHLVQVLHKVDIQTPTGLVKTILAPTVIRAFAGWMFTREEFLVRKKES